MRAELPATGVIIAGAGSGERFGAPVPKAFVEFEGEALLVRSARAFAGLDFVSEMVAVVPAGHEAKAAGLFDEAGLSDLVRAVVPGGPVRQQSVAFGLEALGPGPELVLVHDAARPLASPELILRVARAALEHGAAIPGVPPRDTIKETDGKVVTGTPDRDGLRAIQTPQGFRREILEEAYARAAGGDGIVTDDAALVERLGRQVHIVPGDGANVKITQPEDLIYCKALLGARARGPGKGVRS